VQENALAVEHLHPELVSQVNIARSIHRNPNGTGEQALAVAP